MLCSNIPFSKVHLFSVCNHMDLSCFREGDVFDNHGWKDIVTGVFFCNALFNNFYVTLESQGWKAQLMFFSRVSTFIV